MIQFSHDLAIKYGLKCAILISIIEHLTHPAVSKINMYPTLEAFDAIWFQIITKKLNEIYPYITEEEFKTSFDELIKKGVISLNTLTDKMGETKLYCKINNNI